MSESNEPAQMLRQAMELHQSGQLAQAGALYQSILHRVPGHFDALYLLGVAECQRGNFEAALDIFDRALAINPRCAEAFYNQGTALLELQRHAEALARFDRALVCRSDYAEALNNRGSALTALGRHAEALESYDRTLALKPDAAVVLFNRGNVLLCLARPEQALVSFDRALALMPEHAGAWNHRGAALYALGRPEEALASHDRALSLQPGSAEILFNRGNVLRALRRLTEALSSYDGALRLRPDHLEALINRGNTLLELQRYEAAVGCYESVLAVNAECAEALYNRGTALVVLGRFEEAAGDFERVLRINPGFDYVRGDLLLSQLHCCDWSGYELGIEHVVAEVAAGKRAATPHSFLSLCGSAAQQLQCASTFSAHRCVPAAQPVWRGERYGHGRIRLAYLSADFHGHATAYLGAQLFELHDRSRFEITALSFGPQRRDDMRSRLEGAFERFIDVGGKTDRDIALLMRDMEIDIAVDLKGHTRDSRPGILAHRPAPVQVNFLGFPGTMGAGFIDYIIADRIVIPEAQQSCYAEKVVYLPDTYQPNDGKRAIDEQTPTRTQAGLPERGFVFCSFNDSYKVSPPVFDVWMRLLGAHEDSVLWLLQGPEAAARNLRRRAAERGILPSRLVFAPRQRLASHLARHRLAGLFLDTLPCNAHTTASDALWAGLPVVTCLGESFAGRVAASLLHAVGLPELIARDLEDYEALALDLACDTDRLTALRARLSQNRERCALFDCPRYCRHLESAYAIMWKRGEQGGAPAAFAVGEP